MPDPVTEIQIVARLLDDHTAQDERSFTEIRDRFQNVEQKLDNLLIAVTRLDTLNEVAEKAGGNAGRRTAQIWSAIVAVVVVAVDKVLELTFK